MSFFDKSINITTTEEKFNYIKNHFFYPIMNSWNVNTGIANNVKIYNLGLDKIQLDKAFDVIDCNNLYDLLKDDFDMFKENNKVRVFYNGRNDGYIVMADADRNVSAINDYYLIYSSFAEFREDEDYDDTDEYFINKINNDFSLVVAFDKFCDMIRDAFIVICNESTIVTDIYTIEQTTKRVVCF